MRRIAPIAGAAPGAKDIILCADDYGLSRGVSEAIVSLCGAMRISAASALVNLANWPANAAALRERRERTALGLHFNLTLGRPLGAMPRLAASGALPSLSRILRLSLSGALNPAEIAAEAASQLAAFEAEIGAPPDFVDGHQHVHVLPGVRTVLLDLLAERYPNRKLLVRDPTDRWRRALRRPAPAKALFVACLANGLANKVVERGFIVNSGFSGFSNFDNRVSYAEEFGKFLLGADRGHMVMCHPGLPDRDAAPLDAIGAHRKAEFDLLATHEDIPTIIWRPRRNGSESQCDWPIAPHV